MKQVAKSKILGSMVQDVVFNHWWRSQKIEIPWLSNKKIEIICIKKYINEIQNFTDEIDNTLDYFLNLDSQNITYIIHSIKCVYLEHILEQNEKIIFEANNEGKTSILKKLTPQHIYIEKERLESNNIEITITFKCPSNKDLILLLVVSNQNSIRIMRMLYDDWDITRKLKKEVLLNEIPQLEY